MAAEPLPAVRDPRPPWREIVLAAGLVLFAPTLSLLVFAFPLLVFLPFLRGALGRAVAVALGAALLALLALQFSGSRFFVLAAALSLASSLAAVRYASRVGYAELSLCVVAGLTAAAAVWAVADPGFFQRFGSALEASWQEEGRVWVRRLARTGDLDARSRVLLDQAMQAAGKLYARSWPAATFAVLWLGAASALALAARWSGNGSALAAKVRVTERCALFRLPDLWVWVFLANVVAFLALPAGSAFRIAALNAALVSAGVYAWQGLAIALYFLERRGVRAVGRVLLVAAFVLLLPLPVLIFALGLGLADVGFNFRFRKAEAPRS